jgi:SH3-like domain-containing protein
LLDMSAQEFEKENYGGALYLASQAKSLLTMNQGRPVSREQLTPVAGEVPFATPLLLQIAKTSNVREGPGLEFRVVTTLEKGTRVTGYSYKGQWVRVQGDHGLSGWVFQTLVSGQ